MSQPLAYSYIRMSTELQLKGDSLRRQTELSERYATEHNLELVRDFNLHDIGVSAFKGANVAKGALGRFLDAIKLGEVPRGSFLLVESLDRLSRQTINNSITLFLEITQSGVNIVTLADNQLYRAGETDFPQLIYSIVIMARANEESAIKSTRISAAWKHKREQIGSRVMTRTCPAWLQAKEDKSGFHINEERAKVVRQIFRSAADGQGSGVITRLLNNDGVPVFGKSNGWLESYVTKILKNRAVLGEFQPHKMIDGKRLPVGHMVHDYFPKIIDEDFFLKVQVGRRQRNLAGGGRRGPKHRNLFTHMAKCGYCGSPMRFIDKGPGPKGGRYLRCSASVRGMDCVAASWKYGDFEKSVFSFVREFDLRAIVEDSHQRSEMASLRELRAIQCARLDVKETEQQRVYELLVAQSDASKPFLQDHLDRLSEEIAAIKSEITSIDEKQDNLPQGLVANVEAGQQLSALRRLGEGDDFRSRLLVSTKLRDLIKVISIRSDGQKPKFEKVKALVEESDDDPEFQTRLLEDIRSSQFSGPRSNPYFSVIFHNGSSRTVIPKQDDPTELVWQIDHDDDGVTMKDTLGSTSTIFGPKLTENDLPGS